MEKQNIKQEHIKKEPLLRLVKRDVLPAWKIVLIYAIAIVASLLLSSVICSLFSSENPLSFFKSLFSGAFGSSRRIWLLLQDTALLLGVAEDGTVGKGCLGIRKFFLQFLGGLLGGVMHVRNQ